MQIWQSNSTFKVDPDDHTMYLYFACCHAQHKHEATPLSHMRLLMQPHAPKAGTSGSTFGLFCSGPHLSAPLQHTFLVPIVKHPLRKLAKSLVHVLFNAGWVENSLIEMPTAFQQFYKCLQDRIIDYFLTTIISDY